jgi:hypothetical protein
METAPETVKIEAPKVTVHFERKVQVREYEFALASLHVQAPTKPLTGDSVIDGEMITEAVNYAFFQAKIACFTQLGLEFDITPENVVIERIEKYIPVAEVVTIQAAASPSQTSPPQSSKTEDKTAAWADLAASGKGWWDNRENKRNPKAPDFKPKQSNRKISEGVGLWLDKAPADFDVTSVTFS